MLYQLKRLAINQEQKPIPTKHRRASMYGSNGKAIDRKLLLKQIESVTQNSDGRVKAIEVRLKFDFRQTKSILNLLFFYFSEIRKTTSMSFALY